MLLLKPKAPKNKRRNCSVGAISFGKVLHPLTYPNLDQAMCYNFNLLSYNTVDTLMVPFSSSLLFYLKCNIEATFHQVHLYPPFRTVQWLSQSYYLNYPSNDSLDLPVAQIWNNFEKPIT